MTGLPRCRFPKESPLPPPEGGLRYSLSAVCVGRGVLLFGPRRTPRSPRRYSASLRRIQHDHVDLVVFDPPDSAPLLVEWVEAMGRLVHKGKVLHLAAGSVPAWDVAAFAARATGLPAMERVTHGLFPA